MSSEDLNLNPCACTSAVPDAPSPKPTLGTKSEENIQSRSFKMFLIISGTNLETFWIASEIIAGNISDITGPKHGTHERSGVKGLSPAC